MANAAVVQNNLADAGFVAASSQNLQLPVANLKTPHVNERWRSKSAIDFVVLDFGAAAMADTFMLCGLTASAAATIRVRYSSIDASGAAGDLGDSGVLTNQASAYFDLDYGACVFTLPAPLLGRYVRWDLNDPGAAYVEAGCALAGARTTFDYNFVPGATLGWTDRSTNQKSQGGQTLVWNDNKFRSLDMTFDFVTATQRYGVVETLDRINGRSKNILMMIDGESANLARDSIFGLVSDLTPVATPFVVPIFGKQFKIEERL